MSDTARLTREQQRLLVRAVLSQVGNLVEFQSDYADIADLDPVAVREQLARWMGRLPGTVWDVRLPDPDVAARS